MSTPANAPDASEVHAARGQSLRRAALITACFGLAHAALFLLSYWLLQGAPGARSSNDEVIAFFQSDARRRLLLARLYTMPFSGIAFIWFIVALRMWISGSVRRENVLLSNIQLVSGIVYVTMSFVAAAAAATVANSVEFALGDIDPLVARQFPLFSATISLVFAMRMAAMFVITTTNIGRSAGILPRWFVWVGFGVGLFLLLSAGFHPRLALVFPVWLLILSTLLLLRARRIPSDAVLAVSGAVQRAGDALR